MRRMEGACGVDGSLEVFCQPSIAPDPREEPVDDPTPRVNGEADLIGVLAHDLDRSSTRPRPSVSTSAWRLRPLIFLSGIATACPAGLGGLGTLTVDDCRRLASRPTRSRSAITSAWFIR